VYIYIYISLSLSKVAATSDFKAEIPRVLAAYLRLDVADRSVGEMKFSEKKLDYPATAQATRKADVKVRSTRSPFRFLLN